MRGVVEDVVVCIVYDLDGVVAAGYDGGIDGPGVRTAIGYVGCDGSAGLFVFGEAAGRVLG